MADHLHDGHRARMRERYLRGGLSGLEPHEMLEMLLYHAVPRADTNPTAHALLNTFGSLSGVMSAPPTALRKVDGMTDNAVTMLLFLRDYFRTLHAERLTGTPLDSFAAVKAFFSEIYAFDSVETVRAALLDQKLCLRRLADVQTGTEDLVQLSVSKLSEIAFAEKCSVIILAHNHPGLPAVPSAEDIAGTRQLFKALREVHLALADHVIVGADITVSLRERGMFMGLEE